MILSGNTPIFNADWSRYSNSAAVSRVTSRCGSAQARLDELLAHNAENQLGEHELAELDRLLDEIDHLTLLKTTARYTLQCLENFVQAS